MGAPHPVPRVTPICAVLYGREEDYTLALARLVERWGEMDLESEPFAFTATEYYAGEMGPDLKRRFVSFLKPFDPADLADRKLEANALEVALAEAIALSDQALGRAPRLRPVNLDPGYLTGAKLVLASTKDFAHRIYLKDGIFAEVTLRFRGGRWEAHEFTFPDFRAATYHAFLNRMRDKHLRGKHPFPTGC